MVVNVAGVSIALTAMLICKSIGMLCKIDWAIVGRVCYNSSVLTCKWNATQMLRHTQVSSELRLSSPCHHVRWVTSDSSDSSSSSDSDVDELCIYQPDVRRIRIVTMNDVQTDATLSPSSVQRDTVYTRHHVTADNPSVQSLFQGICKGSRSALAQAITLTESVHPKRRAEAQVLLREVLEYMRLKRRHSLHRVDSFRIGIVPVYIKLNHFDNCVGHIHQCIC